MHVLVILLFHLDLKIYVFKPDAWDASQENPAIVFYFGGGWNSRHITQFVAYAQYYASKGFVCFIPNYNFRLELIELSLW